MRVGRASLRSVLVLLFLLSGCPNQEHGYSQVSISHSGAYWSIGKTEKHLLVTERQCLVDSTLPVVENLMVAVYLHDNGLNDLLFSDAWNETGHAVEYANSCVYAVEYANSCVYCVERNSKIFKKCRLRTRWHRCPCAYYGKSCATFHLTLIGDLVFKLNPGPIGRSIPTVLSVREVSKCNNGNNRRNPLNLSSVKPNRLCLFSGALCHNPLSLCLLNARSVRNKTAMLLDYMCDLKCDVYAITETWLTDKDASVRVELIPDGYNLLDQPREGRGGGGTGLIYRDTLRVNKVDAGEKTSFEYSEWVINTTSHNLRLFIIYRPPYSDEHKVPTSVFFTEFSNYLESVLLSKEPVLLTGD